jgi:arsenate reductase (glutaredoxin)
LSFVDLARRPLAPAELRRFSERLGARRLVDDSSRAYRDGGLAWLHLDDDELAGRLLENPRLLRLPLVRAGNRLAAGEDEPTWRSWLDHG